MSIYVNLLAVISEFDRDQKKPIWDENDILKLFLPAITDPNVNDTAILAEYYAFYIKEGLTDAQKAWSGYYDPGKKNLITGELVPGIPVDKITPEIIAYWKERINQVTNPIFKARYSGLVWELSKPVTGSKADFSIGIIHLENLITSSTAKYFSLFTSVFKKLERALSLAAIFKKEDLLKEAISALRKYEKEVGRIDKPGIWKYSYLLLVKNKKLNISPHIKDEIITELEERLTQSTTANKDGALQLNSADVAVGYLVEYYADLDRMDQVKRVLATLEQAYETPLSSLNPFQQEHNLEKLYQHYKTNDLKVEAEIILKKIQLIGKQMMKEMKPFRTEISLSQEKIDLYIDQCLTGSITEVLYKFAHAFIPSAETEFNIFGDSAIYQFASKGLYDSSGRRTAQVGPAAVDTSGNREHNLANNMSLQSIFLHFAIQAGIDRGLLNAEDIMNYVQASSLIKPANYAIVRAGVNSFLSNDYIATLHLLIPQIEAGCLNLLELNDGNRWEEGRSGGYNLKIFNKVLHEKTFKDSFGEKEAEYFRVLFTEPTGWNLRNQVCHGMMEAHDFTDQKANRVFVALLLVCSFEFVSNPAGTP